MQDNNTYNHTNFFVNYNKFKNEKKYYNIYCIKNIKNN